VAVEDRRPVSAEGPPEHPPVPSHLSTLSRLFPRTACGRFPLEKGSCGFRMVKPTGHEMKCRQNSVAFCAQHLDFARMRSGQTSYDALNISGSAPGYLHGGAAWSFVPAVDVNVTSVGAPMAATKSHSGTEQIRQSAFIQLPRAPVLRIINWFQQSSYTPERLCYFGSERKSFDQHGYRRPFFDPK